MEYREITADTFGSLLPIARQFETEIGSPVIRIDPDVFVATWRRFLDVGVGLVVAALDPAPVGVLCGFVVPDDLNGEPVAQEKWWYVAPSHRRGGVGAHLAATFERLAIARGVKRISLGSIGHLPAVDSLLRHMGYSPFETHYFKVIA